MERKLFPLSIILVLLSLIAFTACEDEPNILYPEVDPFDKLVVAHNVAVLLVYGDQDLSVSGSGDLSKVQLTVSDGILTVSLPNPGLAQQVTVKIHHDELQSVSCSQNGLVHIASDFTTTKPTLNISAYNDAVIYSYFEISVDTLDISLNDDSFVSFRKVDVYKNVITIWSEAICFLEGSAVDQYIQMTGACYYNLADLETGWNISGPLEAENVWVNAKDAATAWVHASSYLNAVGTTGSMVYYKGDPATIDENMSNGAELIQKNQ